MQINNTIGKLIELLYECGEVRNMSFLRHLTLREIEILCQFANDISSKEIGETMCITAKSVENYKNRIGEKLGIVGRRSVVRFAIKNKTILEKVVSTYKKPIHRIDRTQNTEHRTQN